MQCNKTFFFIVHDLDSLSKHSRNLRHAHKLIELVYNDTQHNRSQSEKLLNIMSSEREENRKIKSLARTNVPDMTNYFPLKNDESLAKFLDKSDIQQYDLRRAEFQHLIENCKSTKKNRFATGLFKALFSSDYILSHSWPTNR